MKVLGTEATQDPTRLEKEIRSAAAEREQAHIDRNIHFIRKEKYVLISIHNDAIMEKIKKKKS